MGWNKFGQFGVQYQPSFGERLGKAMQGMGQIAGGLDNEMKKKNQEDILNALYDSLDKTFNPANAADTTTTESSLSTGPWDPSKYTLVGGQDTTPQTSLPIRAANYIAPDKGAFDSSSLQASLAKKIPAPAQQPNLLGSGSPMAQPSLTSDQLSQLVNQPLPAPNMFEGTVDKSVINKRLSDEIQKKVDTGDPVVRSLISGLAAAHMKDTGQEFKLQLLGALLNYAKQSYAVDNKTVTQYMGMALKDSQEQTLAQIRKYLGELHSTTAITTTGMNVAGGIKKAEISAAAAGARAEAGAGAKEQKTSMDDEKRIDDSIKELAGIRRGANAGVYGMASRREALARDGLRIIGQIRRGEVVGNPQSEQELSYNMMSMLAGGNTPEANLVRDFMGKTAKRTVAEAAQFVTSNPRESVTKGFLNQYEAQLSGQQKFWRGEREKIADAMTMGKERIFGRDKTGELKDMYERAKNKILESDLHFAGGSANGAYSDDVLSYATAHNITPQEALAIKNMRGGGAQ